MSEETDMCSFVSFKMENFSPANKDTTTDFPEDGESTRFDEDGDTTLLVSTKLPEKPEEETTLLSVAEVTVTPEEDKVLLSVPSATSTLSGSIEVVEVTLVLEILMDSVETDNDVTLPDAKIDPSTLTE
jgi:hypothetical protein